MRDAEIRSELLEHLRHYHADQPDTRIVSELDLCGSVRVDIAVVNGMLCGYELKSDADTLRRLPEQARVYSQVLDRATLVVTEHHVEAALEIVPDWWAIFVAVEVGGGVALQTRRGGADNPAVDARALVQLLWRDEVLEELAARGMERGLRSKPRGTLWDVFASLPLADVQGSVRRRLKVRAGWRSAP